MLARSFECSTATNGCCYYLSVVRLSRCQSKVITLINLKGGVAKTFTAWTIAGVCQERGRRVLLVDCDAQGNLTGSYLNHLGDEPGVEVLFDPAAEPDVAMLVRRTPFAHIDMSYCP